jgi:histone H3/H4
MEKENQADSLIEKEVNLIIKSNIRKATKNKIANVAEEVGPVLNKKVIELLDKAIERAKANQRKTLHARDL